MRFADIPQRHRIRVWGRNQVGDLALVPALTPADRIATTYSIDDALAREVVAVAGRVGANPYDLANLIYHESGFKPWIEYQGPASQWTMPDGSRQWGRATGLIQFAPSTAVRLGTTVAAIRTMSGIDQMALVERYLAQFRPLDTKQRLYMAVFYPKAQNWDPNTYFNESVRRNNPGINTPGDYVRRADAIAFLTSEGEKKRSGHYVGPGSPPASAYLPSLPSFRTVALTLALAAAAGGTYWWWTRRRARRRATEEG